MTDTSNKFILVTGGAGFIGSHTVDFLLEKNYKVKVYDNLSTGNIDNIKHNLKNPDFEFMYGDLLDLERLRKAFVNVYAVCHLGAVGSVPKSIADPYSTHNANVNGFFNVLLVAKELNIKRIVYASSSSVYGDNDDLIKTECQIGIQLSPYAISKYIDELYAKIFTSVYSMECIGLRYFNVFGVRQNPLGDYAAVIPKFINQLSNNEQPTINGDGTIARDFTHVSNVVEANFLALTSTNKKSFGEVFNIGCGNKITLNEMYRTIKTLLNKQIEPKYVEYRKGDILLSQADITKAQQILNYNPKTNFNQGIIQTIINKNQ